MSRANPYVGPRSFKAGERLYGRDHEIDELVDLLVAERILLLYSPSGAGKSSLIQAGLEPALMDNDFQMLGSVRVNRQPGHFVLPPETNRYIFSILLCLEEMVPGEARLCTFEY